MSRVQWWRNGDHPDDGVGQPALDRATMDTYVRVEGAQVRFFRHPNIAGDRHCPRCGSRWNDHGWIDDGTLDADGLAKGVTVHPGDWLEA